MPLVLSGTRVYCNNPDLLAECKGGNSLLLANHGSVRIVACVSPPTTRTPLSHTHSYQKRIDWMVGMFVGNARDLAGRKCDRVRVGFVCEALIQFMPLIGTYRRIIARDIFVWRSFKRDAPTIKENISEFHAAGEKRMLFLSPEGVVVDFGPKDVDYIRSCRQFCIQNSFSPFDYVLTPRYKGSMCLLKQVEDNVAASSSVKPVISVCNAFVRGGKLLNCSLLSPDRVVPDIYTLNQGIGGEPVDIYIHLKPLLIPQDLNDPKALMLQNYKEKNEILLEWDMHTLAGTATGEAWMDQFDLIQSNRSECLLSLGSHAVLIILSAGAFGQLGNLCSAFGFLYLFVVGLHTLGWIMGGTSKESVPFETGIKSIIQFALKCEQGLAAGMRGNPKCKPIAKS